MANKYLKINLHLVFAAKCHQSFALDENLDKIHAYIAKIINERGSHAIKVGGTSSHVHILLDFAANMPLGDLVRDLKSLSAGFINKNFLSPYYFRWQTGYSCFSVSTYDTERVISYIEHQKEHHEKQSLHDEMKSMLERAQITYDEKYILDD